MTTDNKLHIITMCQIWAAVSFAVDEIIWQAFCCAMSFALLLFAIYGGNNDDR